MKQILMTPLFIFVGSMAFAQQAKVIKVKGQQAIVEFPMGVAPSVGQRIELSNGVEPEDFGATLGTNRANFLSLTAQLSAISSSAGSGTTTTFEVSGRAGWNTAKLEYGPMGTLGYSSASGTSARTVLAGGFFDYNLIPNKSGTQMVYGLGAEGQIGQTAATTGGVEVAQTVFKLFAGGSVKWFGLSDTVALRADAGLDTVRTSSGSVSVTESGLMIKGGIAAYF
jgi:hypothetical protein